MEYKRFEDTILVRVDKDELIVDSLKKVIAAEQVNSAQVTGIGAIDHAKVSVYDLDEQVYQTQEYSGFFEIASLTGNISQKDGEPYTHLHVTLGQGKGDAVVGHLIEARIAGSGEITLEVLPGNPVINRVRNEETGLDFISFD